MEDWVIRRRFFALVLAIPVGFIAVVATEGTFFQDLFKSMAEPGFWHFDSASDWAKRRADERAQIKTVNEIRNTATAMFGWLADQNAKGGKPQTLVDLPIYPAIPFAQVEKLLVPTYIDKVSERDGWGHPYQFFLNAANLNAPQMMAIRSPGREGKFSGTRYEVGGFAPSDFDADIVLADGRFVRWPTERRP